MRPRHVDVLQESGYEGSLDDFRGTPDDLKREMLPELTDELVCFRKENSAKFCAAARERLKASRS